VIHNGLKREANRSAVLQVRMGSKNHYFDPTLLRGLERSTRLWGIILTIGQNGGIDELTAKNWYWFSTSSRCSAARRRLSDSRASHEGIHAVFHSGSGSGDVRPWSMIPTDDLPHADGNGSTIQDSGETERTSIRAHSGGADESSRLRRTYLAKHGGHSELILPGLIGQRRTDVRIKAR